MSAMHDKRWEKQAASLFQPKKKLLSFSTKWEKETDRWTDRQTGEKIMSAQGDVIRGQRTLQRKK